MTVRKRKFETGQPDMEGIEYGYSHDATAYLPSIIKLVEQ
jgi:hypothetical protein